MKKLILAALLCASAAAHADQWLPLGSTVRADGVVFDTYIDARSIQRKGSFVSFQTRYEFTDGTEQASAYIQDCHAHKRQLTDFVQRDVNDTVTLESHKTHDWSGTDRPGTLGHNIETFLCNVAE